MNLSLEVIDLKLIRIRKSPLKHILNGGDQCQYRFNGMWAMAIHGPFRGDLFISRDRFGVKPLCLYFKGHDCIFFASEFKAFSYLSLRLRLECDKIPCAFYLSALIISQGLKSLFALCPRDIVLLSAKI